MGEEEKAIPQGNSALKQLMSFDIQSTSNEKKTILFLGQGSHSGQTIQNISYNNPLVTCAKMEVYNEVDSDRSSPEPKKKKYQCDKCKQIFNQITSFRQHMVGSHTNFELPPPCIKIFICSNCGKNFKDQSRYDKHCMAHDNPDFECPKCKKVYASKLSLRGHIKIHNRKHRCIYCVKSYETFQKLRNHVKNIHTLYMCHDQNCRFVSSSPSGLNDHQHAQTKRDLSRSSREFVRSTEGWTECMDIEGERIMETDSAIANVISNELFVQSTKKRKRHTSPKTCELCQKSFNRTVDLKGHLIEHVLSTTLAKSPISRTGKLMITCEVCQIETFHEVHKYKMHLREHAHLITYLCTICDRSFSTSSNFCKLKKTHRV